MTLNKLLLVVESEWSTSPYEIKYDFEKLLVAKCDVKVMITQSDQAKSIVKKGIIQYSSRKDRSEVYLLANYNANKQDFDFQQFDGEGNEI